jgi:hypothetical protein
MRLRDAMVCGGLAVAALALAPAPAVGSAARVTAAQSDQAPGCGATAGGDFPLGTTIHGGPVTYTAGDAFTSWSIDMTNTAKGVCRTIHPVLVLSAGNHTLKPGQIRLEFYEARARLWRPVSFEVTDEDELIGVFDDGFPGFAIGAGKTLTVPVRLRVTGDAASTEVLANAAVVQRRGDDGDWVGESNDYHFTVIAVPGGGPGETPGTSAGVTPGVGTGVTPGITQGVTPGVKSPELAATGRGGALLGLGGAAGGLLLAGGVLTAAGRRPRPPR